jgi:hypothetical protein
MVREFDAENWKNVSTRERVKRCLKYAEEAERMRQPKIAKQWRDLARELAADQSARPD